MRLKYLRNKMEITQLELTEYLEMDQKTYHNIENNLTIRYRPDILIKLAYLYDVSIDYLIGTTNKKDKFPRDNEKYIIKEYNINVYLVEKIRKEKSFPQKKHQL